MVKIFGIHYRWGRVWVHYTTRERKNYPVNESVQSRRGRTNSNKRCVCPPGDGERLLEREKGYCSCLQQSMSTAIVRRCRRFAARFKTRGEACWRRKCVCLRTTLARKPSMSQPISSSNLDEILSQTRPIARTWLPVITISSLKWRNIWVERVSQLKISWKMF